MEEKSENTSKSNYKEIKMYYPEYFDQNNDKEKLDLFKKRLEAFDNVRSLSDAKALLNKTMPVTLDRTVFYIGDAKCIIINLPKQLRICLKTPTEFLIYHFM